MFLDISNPVSEAVEITNNMVKSTKPNDSHHGFGLYSLNQIVKKHDGDLKLTCENKIFTVSIRLCLSTEE